MLDIWSSEHSVLREKVVEHIFLAELSRTLLLHLGQTFEILRAEFDANGYDVAIEAAGLLRHVQLKVTAVGGKRAQVDVQLALGEKPGGCVVWIFVDPQTLALDHFLWFGGGAGKPLPPLGEGEVRHSRADSSGRKKVRGSLRRLPRGRFTKFDTVIELAHAMFPPTDHERILQSHLTKRTGRKTFAALAEGLTWDASAPLAYAIDGYALAKEAGIDDPVAFADGKRSEAERSGRWQGTVLELWLALFMEHRRDHFAGPIGAPIELRSPPLRDELCATLVEALHRDG